MTLREIIPIHIETGSLDDNTLNDLKSKHYEVVKYELEAAIRLQKWDDIDVLFRVCVMSYSKEWLILTHTGVLEI